MNEAMLRNLTLDELECHLRVTEQGSPAHIAVCMKLDELDVPDARHEQAVTRLTELKAGANNLSKAIESISNAVRDQLGGLFDDAEQLSADITTIQHSLQF
ncbi:hypothetical protein NCG89_00865 [Spongiibacter taiwanensis]|uniref:hypothetical protein n=1 Tax=Spongiibacter taiwanensis TaxID=1748242 RepID=UPI002035B5DF|nr:hypothetical protein [Spongiibacter taiwanensis]USA43354.1 hypothetical protein NCG89_00865 [Spongiibacter taiwanensis]